MQPQYFQQQQQTPNTVNYQQVPVQVQQNAIQPLIQYAPNQILTQQQAIALLMAVPNDVAFLHDFTYRISCCAVNGLCGDYVERSSFQIPGLGEFVLENNFTQCCDCFFYCLKCRCLGCCRCWTFLKCKCRKHKMAAPVYSLRNNIMSFEYYWNGVAKIYVLGNLILEYQETYENDCDMCCGYCYSSQPEIFYSLSSFKEGGLTKICQDPNPCPEDPYGFTGCLSFCGCCKKDRNFEVVGLKQGTVSIKNKRTKIKAIQKHVGCQDCCCSFCRFVDYPEFHVQFSPDVPNIDRIAIIFGLIHNSIYKKWKQHGWSGELGWRRIKHLGRMRTPF